MSPIEQYLTFECFLRSRVESKYKIGRGGGGDTSLEWWYTGDVLTKGLVWEKKGIKMIAVQDEPNGAIFDFWRFFRV